MGGSDPNLAGGGGIGLDGLGDEVESSISVLRGELLYLGELVARENECDPSADLLSTDCGESTPLDSLAFDGERRNGFKRVGVASPESPSSPFGEAPESFPDM